MNFYNPYYYMIPTTGLGRGLFSGSVRNGINWSNILNNTQRTLNIINQAIPAVKQISPMVRNARTMFRVMNEFNRTDTPSPTTTDTETVNIDANPQPELKVEEGPTFFL